jgi:hypothetical protein
MMTIAMDRAGGREPEAFAPVLAFVKENAWYGS